MTVSIIAAIGRNNELGRGNDLIWHFHDDMVFFRETTRGSTVIMGRKTFESLPKALPNRKNIVISANPNYVAQGADVVTSIEKALSIADGENVFIIGGGKIYSEFMKYADRLYLTEIEAECNEADTFFPKFDKSCFNKKILATHEDGGVEYKHVLYSKQ